MFFAFPSTQCYVFCFFPALSAYLCLTQHSVLIFVCQPQLYFFFHWHHCHWILGAVPTQYVSIAFLFLQSSSCAIVVGHWPAMDVVAWVEELKHTEALVQARPMLSQSLAMLLEQKLQGLQAKPHAKCLIDLYATLEASTLPQNLVQRLQGVVDKWANQSDKPLKTHMAPQQLDHLTNYLTKSDWESLAKKNSWDATHTLVSRLRKLGVCSLKESTKKVCVCSHPAASPDASWPKQAPLQLHLPNGGSLDPMLPSRQDTNTSRCTLFGQLPPSPK